MELTACQYKHFYVNVKLQQQANLTFVKLRAAAEFCLHLKLLHLSAHLANEV